jgi:hypothetical protein
LPALDISVNNHRISALDPFLSSHKSTQVLPTERFLIGEEAIDVRPVLLPHLSKLTPKDLELAGGADSLRRNQGFYVYRNSRLISWGSWFRLVRQEEMTKLARVQVDVTNRLDHLWELDIKKSRAYPPESLRVGLRQIIDRITDGSRRVFTYRGRKTPDPFVRAWERHTHRDGVAYQINRNHPLIGALLKNACDEQHSLIHSLLRLLEESIPYDSVYADMAAERRPSVDGRPEGDSRTAELDHLAQSVVAGLGVNSTEARQFLAALSRTEPFCTDPAAVQRILDRYKS